MKKTSYVQPHIFDPRLAKQMGLVPAIVYQGLCQQIDIAAAMNATFMVLPPQTQCYRFEPDELYRYFFYLQPQEIMDAIAILQQSAHIAVWQPKAKDSFWIGIPAMSLEWHSAINKKLTDRGAR